MSIVLRRATRAALATRVLTGRAFIAVAFTASIAFAFTACASAPVTTLGRDASGKIAFTSTTFPTTRLLTLDKEGTSTVVWGTLRLPSDTTRPAPGVIILHGAGGEGLNLSEWARDLNRIGLATFIVDSF